MQCTHAQYINIFVLPLTSSVFNKPLVLAIQADFQVKSIKVLLFNINLVLPNAKVLHTSMSEVLHEVYNFYVYYGDEEFKNDIRGNKFKHIFSEKRNDFDRQISRFSIFCGVAYH